MSQAPEFSEVAEAVPLPAELALAARGIPLWKRDGTIRAFALVDPIDFERFNVHRWHGLRGNKAGTVFYAARKDGDQVILLHREIMGLRRGEPYEVDHVDRDPLNNTRANLRLVTRKQQLQNVRARGGYSEHRGVSFDRNRGLWFAQVRLDGVLHRVGHFETEQAAADAALAFRQEHMPFSNN